MEEQRGPQAYVAEFLGTFVLVFFITMVVTIYAQAGQFIVIGMVHAFVLMALIYSLAGVSGAHFNPAVTTALLALRKIKPVDAAIYILLQFAGGIAAALLTYGLLKDEGAASNYGATVVSPVLGGAFAALVMEGIGTFILVMVIMGVAVNPRGAQNFAGLVIGSTLGFLVMVAAPLTGAGFNPARTLGPAIVGNEYSDIWLYFVGPLVGGTLGALTYNYLFIRTGAKDLSRAPEVE